MWTNSLDYSFLTNLFNRELPNLGLSLIANFVNRH